MDGRTEKFFEGDNYKAAKRALKASSAGAVNAAMKPMS
jgi:hypothetical protein